MDKNQITGIIIIVALLIGYGIYTQPSKEELARRQRMQDSVKKALTEQRIKDSLKKIQDSIKSTNDINKETLSDTITEADSLINKKLKSSFGIFARAASGNEKFVTLENQNIKIKFTTKGAYPYYAEIKNFKTWDGKPLVVFDNNENIFELKFYSENKDISTSDLFFENINGDSIFVANDKKQTVILRLNAGKDKYIDFIYSLEPESYLLKYDIKFHNLSEELGVNSSYLDLYWKSVIRKQEKGAKWESQKSTIYYRLYEDEVKYLTETSDDEEESVDTRVEWISYKDHFFSTVLIADDYFASAEMKYTKDKELVKYIKHCESTLSLPYDPAENPSYSFRYYFGPNDYDILKKIKGKDGKDLNLKRMIPLGWSVFRWVNQFIIIPLFNGLGYLFGNNMGLIILIMTLLIKLALFPLTYKSYISSAKMRVLKPQIDEINKKIPKEKAMERQQATMALYKKVGVNPMGGCLPMLLQMPFLIAMFLFFPASIELRQKSFLWATDLSTYDSVWDFPNGFSIPFYGDHVSLFTLLMAGAMLVSQLLNKNQMSGGNSQMPGMKMMLYLMPVMMLLWFNNYSAGLSYYYFLSNVITIIQTLLIRRMINEDELLEKLNANKKKPKKKSKWQQRIEEMQKIQQQQMRNKNKRR